MITQNQTPTDQLSAYCTGHSACGLSILTSTNESSSCPTGNLVDSATEDFMQGATTDHDNDGKTGDLRDRFTEMDQQGDGRPQLFTCPGQSTLCSQD